jgi:hypothetical protein
MRRIRPQHRKEFIAAVPEVFSGALGWYRLLGCQAAGLATA